MGKTNDKMIYVRQGDANRAKIDVKIKENDFFYGSYVRAADIVNRNIEQANRFSLNKGSNETNDDYFHSKCKKRSLKCSDSLEELLQYSNYIVLFEASRGAGKTSTMLTFGQILKKQDQDSKEVFEALLPKHDKVHFQVLPCIDPTSMEDGDSILRVILSRMFLSFRKRWECYQECNDPENINEQKAELMQQFQRCYRQIAILKQDDKQQERDDNLYWLAEMGDSTNLKVELYELIKRYLDFMDHGSSDSAFLVLQIDDVDMDGKMAYNILEDLRKYFMLPNVIIMMAADLNQLLMIVERNSAEQYRILLEKDSFVDIEKCREMARRYIEKVFPVVSQIHLPQIDFTISETESNLSVAYLVREKDSKDERDAFAYKTHTDADGKRVGLEFNVVGFQERLLREIYEETGIILCKKSYFHEILPKTMRELTHFLEFMNTMEDVPGDVRVSWGDYLAYYNAESEKTDQERKENLVGIGEAMRIRFENLKKFESYFSLYWVRGSLRYEQQIAYESITKASLENKTEQIIQVLRQYENDYDFLRDKFTNEENLADVEYMINQWENSEDMKTERTFLTFLSVYLTVYKSRIALLALMNGRSANKRYLENLKILYGEGEYIKIDFKGTLISGQKFKIDYDRFQKIIGTRTSEKPYQDFERLFIRKQENQVYFDILGPFFSYMQGSEKTADSIWREDQRGTVEKENVNQNIFSVILNNELKKIVQEKLEEKDYLKEEKNIFPIQAMNNIYSGIAESITGLDYLDIESRISELIVKDSKEDQRFITSAFLCNTDIAKFYFDRLKEELLKIMPNQLDMISEQLDKKQEHSGNNSLRTRMLEYVLHYSEDTRIFEQKDLKSKIEGYLAVCVDQEFDNMVKVWEKYQKQEYDVLNNLLEVTDGFIQEGTEQGISEERRKETEHDVQEQIQKYNDLLKKWRNEIEKLNYSPESPSEGKEA